ncbi:MAG: hypothetical protein WCZ87_12750 [Thiohalobacteraceae bacterium]
MKSNRLVVATIFSGLLSQQAIPQEVTPQEHITPYGDEGCWVSVFRGEEFGTPSARLVGPTFLEGFVTGPVVSEDLAEVGGQDFMADIGSLIVGPQAEFLVYEEEKFANEILRLEPGQRVPDLSALRWKERAKSAQVRCAAQE